ncbi:hypothetical protein FO519_005445 [Halicephalobus sp. NKZ332]|nr:hypothetical protein FO519_005445 [Halicephalobus sp. NKZ332]
MSLTKRKRKRKLSSPSVVDKKILKECDVERTCPSPEYSGNDDEFAELPDNQEDKTDYGPFGYMLVEIGQQIQNFTIIRKTGVGTFSTMLTNIKNQDETCLGYHRVIHVVSRIMVGNSENLHNCLIFKPIGTSLYSKILKSETGLEAIVLRKLSKQILEGLCFLHEHCNLIHSDIKSDNILITMPRKQLYGLVRKVVMEDFRGPGMRMNVGEEVFSSSNFPELKNDFETIISHCRTNTTDSGTPVERGILEIPMTEKDKEAGYLSKSALVTMELLNPEAQVKIIDLGGAVSASKKTTRVISTFEFRAPEVILGDHITTSADIWSFACTFYEMATARHLFYSNEMSEESEKDLFDEIINTMNSISEVDGTPFQKAELYKQYFNKKGKYKNVNGPGMSLIEKFGLVKDKCFSEKMTDFVKPMLIFDPKNRPTARECLNSDFLKDGN